MREPKLLWTPSDSYIKNSNVSHFIKWLKDTKDLHFKDYADLWDWSTTKTEDFWKVLVEYFKLITEGKYSNVMTGTMPHVNWFEGLHLNYAEHIFRSFSSTTPAIIFQSEDKPREEISWPELKQKVASFQKFLLDAGIVAGDRVVALVPCIPEATIAFLATNSLGAIWSSCSPDFGSQSVIDRFAQINPKVLIAVDGYFYGGKYYDKQDVINQLAKALPGVEKIVLLNTGSKQCSYQHTNWSETIANTTHELQFHRVPFNHPIWVLYSSGTTGLPKAIVHSHGGILLEQLKYLTFHNDVKAGERYFWYTTTGWMMWNYIHGSLLCGATLVLYDGSLAHPDMTVIWKFIQEIDIHHFGTSAGFLLSCMKAGIDPRQDFNLSSLRSLSSTGSTLPPEGFDWVYSHVKKEIWLASISGGTDVCSAFVGGNPTWPVFSGEIQCRTLGCLLESFNENRQAVLEEVGEMVVSKPMPSMPIYFWNDPEYKRYLESYFELFPGKWRHGDWIEITARQGVIIYGRSDTTLNRGGVRIGTSEIYRAVDKISEVKDSLIVCIEKEKGEFYMPLFVVMVEGQELTEAIQKKIIKIIRSDNSPRHVPDEIISAPDIPYTISGKKTESPVKKVLQGRTPSEVVNAGALRNPESMNFFIDLFGRHLNQNNK
ncbi:MAG: acetoacetate--CoA ligase [Bacteroidia bacterium]|nr:acetoacetate--CoA ligase [Bacteroidia bacterium]